MQYYGAMISNRRSLNPSPQVYKPDGLGEEQCTHLTSAHHVYNTTQCPRSVCPPANRAQLIALTIQ